MMERNISDIPKEDWEALFDLIPKIENSTNFGEFVATKGVFPYASESEIIVEFREVLWKKRIEIVFDWPEWEEGIKMLKDKDADFSNLDLTTLVKLLTTAVRADRFSMGLLMSKFSDGTILNILYRLRAVVNEDKV